MPQGQAVANFPSRISRQTITIASGQTESEALGLGAGVIVGIQTPAALTSTAMTFKVSSDGENTYKDMYNDAGTQVSVTVAADRFIRFVPQDFAGVESLKLVMGTAEGADRDIIVTFRAVD